MKIDLTSKRRRISKGKNWTRLIAYIVFGLISAAFLGITLYVLISISVLNGKINKVDAESKRVSSEMLKNSENVNRFVLSKLILTEIQAVNKDRFRYKDYLDEVQRIIPQAATLAGVDFSTKGWLSVSVNAPNYFTFTSVESILFNKETWSTNKYFSNAFIESVNRDKSGSYTYRLKFELKKLNGTTK